ncbi:MAG TPA: VWA domain-containing protein [Candidatus Limnocylindria bacterium]
MAEVSGLALLRSAVGFGRELRAVGLSGDLTSAMDFARALTLIEIGDQAQVRAAGAACFVRRRDELPIYHQVFSRWWRRRANPGFVDQGPQRQPTVTDAGGEGDAADEEELGEGELIRRVGWSPVDVTRQRQFAHMTAEELREAERLIDELGPRLAVRRTRRHEPHAHGRRVDPRLMLRRSLATGGEPLDWTWQRPTHHPRPIVALIDISGSMERHARLLLRFVHALARTPARTEAFVFGTQLHRVTRILRERDPDVALERIGSEASYGAGGTRIGHAFGLFNRQWARRVLPGSGIVVVLSDGWDHGKPELIAAETARLSRRCHELVWLNPLAGSEGYEPLVIGMAAALPHVDRFLPAGSVADLEALGALLAAPASTRRAA